MATERPAPTISTSPDPSTDGGLRTQAPARRGGGREGGAGRSVALNVVLAILVAGLMVAGWFVANQHQLLLAEQQAREDAEARLSVLEDRLRVTDETLTESGADTSKQINFWESEIRKLWAVSNERNKDWIKANESALGKQSDALARLTKGQSSLEADVKTLDAGVKKLADMQETLDSLNKRVVDMNRTQQQLVDRVNAARQAVASLQAGLANRVEDNEQAVASIDAFRAQINQRVNALEQAQRPGT